jgi:lysozyme family protein
MADFKKYAPKLLQLEGGYTNHPDDLGGPTNKGVTLNTYREYCGIEKTIKDLRNMSYGVWCDIMKDMYWDKCKADKIDSQPLAEILVDWCVNSGMVGLRKEQELVGTKPDGICGTITLSLINSSDAESLFDRIMSARKQFYVNIVKKNPSQKVFMNGWMNRLGKFKFEA